MLDVRRLENLYRTYNKACYIDQDPLRFLLRFKRMEDREIVGLIASCLAFGNVKQIGRSVEAVLLPMKGSPRSFLEATDPKNLLPFYTGFRHRYVGARELCELLAGIQRNLALHGSLNRCFLQEHNPSAPSVLPALGAFVKAMDCPDNYLLPPPDRGSACKRLHLYLRWMVREDDVDPGGWTGISPAKLLIPLDTHMARLSRQLRLTRRRSPNAAMALEITRWFSRRIPHDPVRYDFTLTRFGIHPDLRRIAFPIR